MPNDKKRITRRDLLRAAVAGGATASLGLLVGEVTNRIQVEHATFRLPRWNADGFRAAVISDLHMDSPERLKRALRAFRMAVDERPDAILIPGDFLTFGDDRRIALLEKFSRATADAPCPVLATLGNHDYWVRNPSSVIRTLERSRIRLLRNETAEVDGVTIAGIDDGIAGRHQPDVLREGHASKSLLAMLHEPDFVAEMPQHVSLQVSGHSHGGQVRLPLGVVLHTPKGARKYVDGYYPDARVPLFVSRGVGTTGPDFRLYCPPQVAVLTLQEG